MMRNRAKMSSHWFTLRLKISVYWNFHSVEYWYTSTHGKDPETCGKRLLTADAVSLVCWFMVSFEFSATNATLENDRLES